MKVTRAYLVRRVETWEVDPANVAFGDDLGKFDDSVCDTGTRLTEVYDLQDNDDLVVTVDEEEVRASELNETDRYREYGDEETCFTLIDTIDRYGDTIIVNNAHSFDIDEVVARIKEG